MSQSESLDILLDTTPLQPYGREFIITPLSRGETYVAKQGLPNRLSYYFNKDRERLTVDERLWAVYIFLTEKIDRYRTEARNVAKTLEKAIPSEPADRIIQALAMSSVMLAQHARKKGWPNKSLIEEIQKLKLQEAMALDMEDFNTSRAHLAGIAIENDRYWVSRLQASRSHYVVPMFRSARAQSKPEKVEV